MYEKYLVVIPLENEGVTVKKIKGVRYVYYTFDRNYSSEKHYTVPKATTIGKCDEATDGMMYPNANFFKFFPDAELPEGVDIVPGRSSCQHIGAYLVIRKIVAEYQLDKMADVIFGKDGGLFLDLAAYSILTENNASQYYPDYAWSHPLFTPQMKIFSDSKVGTFLASSAVDQQIEFQDRWNGNRNHKDKIYISYDSTNKHCQAGDIELAELGHEKDKQGKPIFNYAIAYDHNNEEPLFYEEYPGSINDVAQLQCMLGKAAGYGYKNVGFILDRGYFSEPNIRYMDKHGYDFLIMVKGMKDIVSTLVMSHKGSFEQSREYSIRSYKVSGMTIKSKLFATDEKERYFHLYHSDRKQSAEREVIESKIDRMGRYLKDHQGENIKPGGDFKRYFDLIYYHEGQPDEKFMVAKEKRDVIDKEIALCGYFVIISSEKMTAEDALDLYKSRDVSEKLFKGDKSYLGNRSMRTQTDESIETKILIEFVALIIRNKIYTCLRNESRKADSKANYMTVPAALKELEKIEMIKSPDGEYRLNYAVSATQKAILKAFGMTSDNIKKQAKELGTDLKQ